MPNGTTQAQYLYFQNFTKTLKQNQTPEWEIYQTKSAMGLDMYLSKKTYVQNWSHMTPDKRHSVTVKCGGVDVPHIKPERVSYIEEQIHSWRKSNQIHRWFVENVQGGMDNCEEYFVSRDNLRDLLHECRQVIAKPDHSSEILPTVEGCFFGSTDYDEFYFQDIKETAEMLEKVLEEEPENQCDFYYRSSW